MVITRSTIIKSILWKYLEKSGTQGVSFIVSIVLARLIGPREFGLIAIVLIMVELSNVIVDGGFNSALIQKKNPTSSDFSTILYVSLAVSLILYALLYVTAPYIALFYSEPRLTDIVRILCLILFIKAFNSVQNAYVSKNMLFKKAFLCNFSASLFSGAIGVLMAYLGFGIWALVTQQIMLQLGVCTIMWLYVRWRPTLAFSKTALFTLFSFGWKIFMTNTLVALSKNVRGLFIGKMFGASDLAFFERGKQFPHIIIDNLSATIQSVLFPVFANKQDDTETVKVLLRRSIKTYGLLVFPVMIALIVMAKPVIILVLTEKWLPTLPFVQIFSLAYLLMPIQTANMQVITALGRSDLLLKMEIGKKVLEFAILIVSLMMGVYAVAWGVVLYVMLSFFINLYPNRRLINYGYTEQFKDMVPMLLLSLVMGILMYIPSFYISSIWLLICTQIMIGVLSYSLMCYFFHIEAFVFVIELIKKYKK